MSKIEFNINSNGVTYFCSLRKQYHSYVLSCDDEHGNEIAYSTNVDEDTVKLITMLLMLSEDDTIEAWEVNDEHEYRVLKKEN